MSVAGPAVSPAPPAPPAAPAAPAPPGGQKYTVRFMCSCSAGLVASSTSVGGLTCVHTRSW
ncbi:hypothetical protein JYU34_011602 [Plutella xylostella]|uniref:Uncharacterized protein n=1 Tax=Plutella xylostella TaxID=51655 RepID=A0ABQ7QHD6_PLUXY|nr:hypothetical protein JYU34_011602 [Plutella xylostella]